MIAQLHGTIQEFVVLAFIVGTVCIIFRVKGVGKFLVSLMAVSMLVTMVFNVVRQHPIVVGILTILMGLGVLAVAARKLKGKRS